MASTVKQKKAARAYVKNLTAKNPKTTGQILEDAGYKPGTVVNPHEVIESKGFQEELHVLGFTLASADETVGYLLKHAKREETQLIAAQTIYKRLGGYAPEKRENVNVNIDANRPERINRAIALITKR